MNEKLLKLAVSLTQATERGQVNWDATLSDVFRASVGKGYVTVSERFDPELDNPIIHTLQVTDNKGRVVELADYNTNHNDILGNVKALYMAARRSALNSRTIVDDMLAAIGGK